MTTTKRPRGRPRKAGGPMPIATLRVTQAQLEWLRSTPGAMDRIRAAIDRLMAESAVAPPASRSVPEAI